MELLERTLATLVDYAWGLPLVFLLMGRGLFLFAYSGFIPLTGFFHGIRILSGKVKHHGEEKSLGQISHFKALANAVAATIGLGNISGVAIALTQGGPGAIFWMWISAIIGMNTKFFECTLAIMYRGQDYEGEIQGGPMYYIKHGLGKHWLPLAYAFALFGFFGTYALFQSNQLAEFVEKQYSVPRFYLGAGIALVVYYILKGGLQRLAQFTFFPCTKYVPTLCSNLLGNHSYELWKSSYGFLSYLYRSIYRTSNVRWGYGLCFYSCSYHWC